MRATSGISVKAITSAPSKLSRVVIEINSSVNSLSGASKITLVAQINGKVKDKIEVDADSPKEVLEELALNSEKIKELTQGKQIVKVIVVPNKLVNIVVK